MQLLQQVHLFTNHVTVHCWTTLSTTFYQWSSTYPFSDLLSNYPLSSMRCPIKQRLLTHHTNYILLCSIHPHYTTTCFLTTFHQQCVQQLLFTRILFIPCHTLKLFQKLQWGFKLTHNSIFCENVFLCITYMFPWTPNTSFDHIPAKGTKLQQNYEDKFFNSRFNNQPLKDIKHEVSYQQKCLISI